MSPEALQKLLSDELAKLRAGESTPERGNAVANLAGKILATARLEMEYAKATGAVPSIPFLRHQAAQEAAQH